VHQRLRFRRRSDVETGDVTEVPSKTASARGGRKIRMDQPCWG
jgi:hypothetical protein